MEKQDAWELRYGLVKEYFQKHNTAKIPVDYRPQGIPLNKWLNDQKQICLGKRPGKSLSSESIQKLRAIGVELN